MSTEHPRVEISEEGMREGMQIEDKSISVADKIRLLNALSDTGLKHINVGSFVSARYTPQMEHIEEVVQGFTPKPGVTYFALALNERGRERARQFSPPLTTDRSLFSLGCHLCDVFIRRNANVSRDQEIARWPAIVSAAVAAGATEAGIGLNAAWGSNFLGEFSEDERMDMLGRQHALLDAAGIRVTAVSLGDPMSWNRPLVVESQILRIVREWPEITRFSLHLHNARGLALVSFYSALRVLDARHTIHLDTTIGGIGGCPYCGNGRATGMIPTEDVVHLLDQMGIETGIDIEKLVRVVWMLEEILGRPTMGHVSKAGPLPRPDQLYDPNIPFVETFEQARHFLMGPSAYEGGLSPWAQPITSPELKSVKHGA